MARADNIFYNLVTDENSTTELLCNLMRFSAFRMPVLRCFLENSGDGLAWEDLDTQVDLGPFGRPDMQIRSSEVVALIEVKVSPTVALTSNQPHGYLQYLRAQKVRNRWLLFLVPGRWIHLGELKLELAKVAHGINSDGQVQARIVLWEDILELLEDNDLPGLNPFMQDFYQLLHARVGTKCVSFTAKEIVMLYSNEIPEALTRLQQLVDGVRDLGSTHAVKPSASRSLCPSEYGLYFLDPHGKAVFWFGVWTDFWKVNATPLCFGVTENSTAAVRQSFEANYAGTTKHFEKYILGWFGPEVLSADNAVERVWTQLSPLVEATLAVCAAEQGSHPNVEYETLLPSHPALGEEA